MASERFQVTEEQIRQHQQAYAQAREGVIRIRYQVVRLYVQGYPTPEII